MITHYMLYVHITIEVVPSVIVLCTLVLKNGKEDTNGPIK